MLGVFEHHPLHRDNRSHMRDRSADVFSRDIPLAFIYMKIHRSISVVPGYKNVHPPLELMKSTSARIISKLVFNMCYEIYGKGNSHVIPTRRVNFDPSTKYLSSKRFLRIIAHILSFMDIHISAEYPSSLCFCCHR